MFSWLGREFVDLSAAAQPRASVEEETDSLFRSFEQELKADVQTIQAVIHVKKLLAA